MTLGEMPDKAKMNPLAQRALFREKRLFCGGFTLMELMVYIAIMGIIVIVAGQAFSDSTKMRIRTQSMLRANDAAGKAVMLIKDDIAQMGAKSTKEVTGAAASDGFTEYGSNIYMHPTDADDPTKIDSSSFILSSTTEGTKTFSDIKTRRVRYDSDGKYMSVEEVRWFVEDNTLKRSCWTVAKRTGLTLDAEDPCVKESSNEATVVSIVGNVSEFTLRAGEPNVKIEDEQLFPPSGNSFMLVPRFGETYYNLPTVDNAGTTTTISGFATNFDKYANQLKVAAENPETVERNQLYAAEYEVANFEVNSWKAYCGQDKNKFTFDTLVTYEISFTVLPPALSNKMEMFTPGRDFLAVGFRDNNGEQSNQLKDFLFYPPTTQENEARKRSMRFNVGKIVKNQCLVFTFASYSPVTAEGSLIIENLKLKKVATTSYTFGSWNPEAAANIVEKKNVKAFELTFKLADNGEEGVVEETILTPSNGPRD